MLKSIKAKEPTRVPPTYIGREDDLIKKTHERSQQDCLQQAQHIGREDDLIKKTQEWSQQECLQQASCNP
jgi:hypothetical protein